MLTTTNKRDKSSQANRHDENVWSNIEKYSEKANAEHYASFKIKASYNLADNSL